MPGLLSDLLGWGVILLFTTGALLVDRDRDQARLFTTAAWGGFAVFWAQLVPWFAFSHKSYVEGFLSLAAVPACLYAGYLVYSGRDTLFVLSRAVAAMGLVYLPFETIPAITVMGLSLPAPQQVLIETVAAQTGFITNLLGYSPALIPGPKGYMNTYRFVEPSGHRLEYTVVLACTGLGSMAIFAGLIAAVRAPLDRKLRAFAISIPIIYALNIARVTFIGIVFGNQYMQWFVDEVLFLFGATDPYRVSFFLSDRVISQIGAVFALVGVIYLVVRELPELLTVIEDVLFMMTGDEYDLARQLDLPRVPDGGEEVE
jgi:archaeosortase A (PGF-CTERM-specific)